MKKIITSAGCLALGVAGLNAAFVFPNTGSVDPSRFWSASVSLRGFYDDNPTTVHSHEQESWGFQVRPSLSISLWPQGQTYLGLSYTYDMRYYFERDDNRADHAHDLIAKFDHAFNERYRLLVTEWLTIAQEPAVSDTSGGISVPIRTKGDYTRNRVTADFQGDLTERLGFELGYGNTIYDYEQGGVGGYSSILDRMEHLAHLDLRWRIRPELIGVFGYQFGYNDYSGDSAMYFDAFGNKVTSDVRDSYNHYIYGGIDHSFTAKLKGSIRLGAQYVDYTDALPGTDNKWTPYADSSLTYTYMPDSYLQVGVKVTRLATDIVSPDSSGPTEDQEARTIYAMVNHKFTSRFTANIIGQYQNAEFSEGAFDNDKDKLYLIGVNLDYALTKYFGLEAGYNYDKLDSDVPNRSYNRNRFYFGIRATY
jgi:hypothetical protein